MRYLIFLLLLTASLFAAEFKIESFERADGDLTAISANVKDVNDELCGQIKIYTEFTDLVFESSPSPMKIVKLTGEIRVFLTPGTRFLMFRKEGFVAFRYVFEQKIEPGVSYRLKLGSEGLKLEVAEVNFITNPTEAKIFIDGEDMGIESLQKVIVGTHDLKVVKLGFEPVIDKITVVKGKNKFEYKLKEVEEVPISFTSKPDSTVVFLDDVKIGTTPLTLFYPIGKYNIRVAKKGFQDITDTIAVIAPKTVKSFEMKEATSYLTIKTNPGAEVYLNGERFIELNKIKLAEQQIDILIKMKNSVDLNKTVFLKNGDDITLELLLQHATGTIKVAVLPDDAQIELKSEHGDIYKAQGSKAFNDLLVGQYDLTVNSRGYIAQSEKIDLSTKTKVNKSITLKKGLTGKVQIAINPPNAAILMKDHGGNLFESKGSAVFDSVLVGKLEFSAKADGYITESRYIPLNENENITRTIVLKQGKDDYLTNPDFKGFDYIDTKAGLFVLVKGGTFKMGGGDRDNENPVHNVTLKDFIIGKYEVSQKEWMSIMEKNPSSNEGDSLPVENVSWNDCQEFIKKLNAKTGEKYRLPTEAEWEYAAYAANPEEKSKLYSGGDLDKVGWYSTNSNGKSHPCGQKRANGIGLFDMTGNVSEWCNDWFGNYSADNQIDPQGAAYGSARIIRGGSWFNAPTSCRITKRDYFNQKDSYKFLGFRLVRNI